MKLLSCYVTAFAGITDREYSFADGITEICEANGTGKSTLAAFLKVMLYGLEGATKKTLSENEFRLYAPFGGGRFGGSLTFLFEGREYRLERYFEGKNEELRVFDLLSGTETERFGAVPGATIFGTDADSFLRTVYLSSRRSRRQGESPVGITAKLNDLAEEVFDLCDYDAAVMRLTEARKEIKLYRGVGGRLAEAEERRRELALRLREAEGAGTLAEREGATAAEAEAEAERLTALYRETDTAYRSATRHAEEERTRTERLAAANRAIDKERDREAVLLTHFPHGIPTDDELNGIGDLLAKRNACAASLADTMAYIQPMPSAEEIEAARNDLRRSEELNAAATTTADESDPVSAGRRFAPLAAIAAIPAALGAALAFFLPFFGIAAIIGSALALAAIAYGYRRALLAEQAAKEAALIREGERAARLAEGRAHSERAEAFLSRWRAEGEEADATFARLVSGLATAKVYAKQTAKAKESLNVLNATLTAELARYANLSEEPDLALRELRAHTAELTRIQESIRERKKEAADLTPPTEPTAEAAPADPRVLAEACTALSAKITAERERAATAREKANGYHRRADEREDILDAIEVTNEQIAALSRRVGILDTAAELLKRSKEELEERHLLGVRETFTQYLTELAAEPLTEATVDRDLGISFLARGESHSGEHLSSGWQAVADVCLRLALCDRLYPDAPPPLILDDPFVMLDEENLKKARALLARLGERRQILYLTCHPSRKLN